jgi:hypothetical protein
LERRLEDVLGFESDRSEGMSKEHGPESSKRNRALEAASVLQVAVAFPARYRVPITVDLEQSTIETARD